MLRQPAVRILLPALVLAVYYRSLSSPSPTGTAPASAGESRRPTPDESRELVEKAEALRREGEYGQAAELTLELHHAYPSNYLYMRQLATLYGRLGRHTEESRFWELFLEHAPLPIEGCPLVGQSYQKQGLADKAVDAFERCLAFDPQNADSIFYLAQALERAKDFDRAASLYTEGARLAPDYHDLLVGLARVNLHQGKTDAAREMAARVLSQAPRNADALLVMGLATWRAGDRRRARTFLEDGIEVAAGYTDLYLALGAIAEEENDPRRALATYDRALTVDPENSEAAARRNAVAAALR